PSTLSPYTTLFRSRFNQVPLRPPISVGCRHFDGCMEDGEAQFEMGEDVGNDAARSPLGWKRRAADIVHAVLARCPAGRRHFGHASEQTFFGTLAQQDGSVRTFRNEGGADTHGLFRLGLLQGKAFLNAFMIRPAIRLKRAKAAGRPAR